MSVLHGYSNYGRAMLFDLSEIISYEFTLQFSRLRRYAKIIFFRTLSVSLLIRSSSSQMTEITSIESIKIPFNNWNLPPLLFGYETIATFKRKLVSCQIIFQKLNHLSTRQHLPIHKTAWTRNKNSPSLYSILKKYFYKFDKSVIHLKLLLPRYI